MEEIQKLFWAYVSKVLGMSKEDAASLVLDAEGKVTEGALAALIEKDKDRIKDLKTAANTDGFNKAKVEAYTKLEKELKDKYGVSTDKKGVELVDLIVEKKTANPEQVTEDVIKKHPLYLAKEDEVKTVETKVTEKLTAEFNEKEKTLKMQQHSAGAKSKALVFFDELKPILSSDPTRAANQKNLFLRELDKYNFEPNGDDYTLIDPATNKRLEDAHGHPVKFKDLVKEIASTYYDFQAAKERTGGGDPGGDNQDKTDKKYKGALPKTAEEYTNIVTDRSIPLEQRMEVKQHWEELQKAAAT